MCLFIYFKSPRAHLIGDDDDDADDVGTGDDHDDDDDGQKELGVTFLARFYFKENIYIYIPYSNLNSEQNDKMSLEHLFEPV